MAAYAPQSSRAAVAQINITPLVDVMLVLLVIFMVAAPSLTASLNLDLPAPTKTETEPPPRTVLTVTEAGEYVLEGQVLAASELSGALDAIATRHSGTVLEIAASGNGDYQSFATALAAARASGLSRVALQQ